MSDDRQCVCLNNKQRDPSTLLLIVNEPVVQIRRNANTPRHFGAEYFATKQLRGMQIVVVHFARGQFIDKQIAHSAVIKIYRVVLSINMQQIECNFL